MLKLLIIMASIFPLLTFAVSNLDPATSKQTCLMNKAATVITCSDGRVYKLHPGSKNISYRVNTKLSLRNRLPASN